MLPSSLLGVPTVMNVMEDDNTADLVSSVQARVPLLTAFFSSGESPASWMGGFPLLSAASLSWSTSTPITRIPLLAKLTAVERPT